MDPSFQAEDWTFLGAWGFIVSEGQGPKFHKWCEQFGEEHGDYLMETLADMYLNARPKLKAKYTAELVARRMEK